MLHTEKELKIYYSVKEVADMFGVKPSLLRFWEKEFPQIAPKIAGRGIRQYRKEDVETVKLIYAEEDGSLSFILKGDIEFRVNIAEENNGE